MGHLNISSIRNKFILAESTKKSFDLFLTAESKLDSTFPMNQFRICGYKVFRHDLNRFGGGLMLYISENMSCRPPVYNGPLTDGPLSVCAFLSTLLVHFFRNFTVTILWSCCTFSVLYSFQGFPVLHYFHVALFSYCIIFMLFFCAALSSCCTFFVLVVIYRAT